MTVSGVVQGLAMEYMMEQKNSKTIFWGRMLYWTIFTAIASAINVLGADVQATHNIRAILYWGCVVCALIFFYKDPFWRMILAIFLVFFAYSLSEFGLVIAFYFTDIDMTILEDRTKAISIFMIGVGMLFSCVACLILVILWKKAFNKGRELRYAWFIVLYALNYFGGLFVWANSVYDSKVDTNETLAVVFGTLCQVALLFIVFSQVEKESMENHLSEVKRQSELEQIHYEEIARHRENVAEIIEKNSQDLHRVKTMLQKNKFGEAEEKLQSLLQRINQTKEYPYCTIPVVNLILSEKQRECDKYNLRLVADIHLPNDSRIKQIELCSVFGNLLDNAIRASRQANCVSDKMKSILLSAGVNRGYLIIKCENVSEKEPGLVPEGTGYGLKILGDIAKRYEGNLQTQYEKQKYKVQLSLKL